MAFFEIDDDVLGSLGDDIKGKLKEYTPPDIDGLKANANKILSEKKALEAKYAEAEAEVKKLKVAPPKGEDAAKIQSQLDDAMAKLKEKDDALSNFQKEVKREKLNSEAMKIAAELTRDNKRANLLAEKIASRIDIDNGSLVVLDSNGNPTVSTADDLKSSIKSEYDFLVDGSQAAGGGAQGGSGGAANAKTVKRSDWDSMDHSKRSELSKSGTKVIDD